MSELSTQERFKRGAPDAGRYFSFMSDFIGFSPEHADAIRETRFVIEKHIPAIVGEFYAQVGIARTIEYREVLVGMVDEIPEGQRKIIDAEGLSIGVFHQDGQWVALQNSCLHRGGPVCAGDLTGGTLTCPWHGYQYALASRCGRRSRAGGAGERTGGSVTPCTT